MANLYFDCKYVKNIPRNIPNPGVIVYEKMPKRPASFKDDPYYDPWIHGIRRVSKKPAPVHQTTYYDHSNYYYNQSNYYYNRTQHKPADYYKKAPKMHKQEEQKQPVNAVLTTKDYYVYVPPKLESERDLATCVLRIYGQMMLYYADYPIDDFGQWSWACVIINSTIWGTKKEIIINYGTNCQMFLLFKDKEKAFFRYNSLRSVVQRGLIKAFIVRIGVPPEYIADLNNAKLPEIEDIRAKFKFERVLPEV